MSNFALVLAFGEDAVIDETEIDDVDGDLGIKHLLELVPDLFLDRGVLEPIGFSFLLLLLLEVDA